MGSALSATRRQACPLDGPCACAPKRTGCWSWGLRDRRGRSSSCAGPPLPATGDPADLLFEAERSECLHRVRSERDTSADLSQFGRSLVDRDLETSPTKRTRRGQTADATADHRDTRHPDATVLRRLSAAEGGWRKEGERGERVGRRGGGGGGGGRGGVGRRGGEGGGGRGEGGGRGGGGGGGERREGGGGGGGERGEGEGGEGGRGGGGGGAGYFGLGLTTSALPPPSRTGSAIASARPWPSICSAVASPG